jgi:GDP-L-fucose synthase
MNSYKKVLITGSHGFIGKNITLFFKQKDFDLFLPKRNELDLCDFVQVSQYISNVKPDVIIHTAADAGGLGYNLTYPADILYNNILMNLNILKSSSDHGVKKIVNINSACVYPSVVSGDLLNEEKIFDGKMHESVEAYGFSKRSLIVASNVYKKQYNLEAINLILTNVYGIYDQYSKKESPVVPALIKKLCSAKIQGKKSVSIWGSGNAVREFIFSKDVAEAVFIAMTKYKDCAPLNIGTGIGISIKDLVYSINQIIKYEGKIHWDKTKPDGAPFKVLDISNMKNKLKWEPPTKLINGLKESYEWYCSNIV